MSNGGDELDRWALFPAPDVVALIPSAPVPEIVPADLAESVVPIRSDGELIDWQLRVERLIAVGVVRRYWSWRSSWERQHRLAPADSLAELLAVAEMLELDLPRQATGMPSTLVGVLRAATREPETVCQITPHQAEQMVADIEDLRAAVELAGGEGIALVDDMRPGRGLLRCWPAMSMELLIAANPLLAVSVHPQRGLVVTSNDPVASLDNVSSVNLTGERTRVHARNGSTLGLDAEAARPLAWLAPGTLRWAAQPIALSQVWQSSLDALLAIAAAGGGRLTITAPIS